MINKYIVVCPNCGTKLITVCSNATSDTYCPQCYQQLLCSFSLFFSVCL